MLACALSNPGGELITPDYRNAFPDFACNSGTAGCALCPGFLHCKICRRLFIRRGALFFLALEERRSSGQAIWFKS